MKPDIDFEEQRTRIDKMIIDMEHNVEQRNHWGLEFLLPLLLQ